MSVFAVTTRDDIVNANDGKLSLREAIAAAEKAGSTEASTIVFDPTVFVSGQKTISLHQTLTIDAGAKIVIDGTLSTSSQVWLSSDGTQFGELVRVAAGASVTLHDLKLTSNQLEKSFIVNGIKGADGADGIDGADGSYAEDGEPLLEPTEGLDARKGHNGSAGSAGSTAVGGIVNGGNLTLERVSITGMNAKAGDGGNGGNGGEGGYGGEGGSASFQFAGYSDGTNHWPIWDAKYAPGDGGNGGNGGNGGDAGDGGNAAGGILNTGNLVLRDVEFAGLYAKAGWGGTAGSGGAGGVGGAPGGYYFQNDNPTFRDMDKFSPPIGGNGGNAGLGGAGGKGGTAATALLNVGGTVTFNGVQTSAVSSLATKGQGRYGGMDQGPGTGGAVDNSRESHTDAYFAWPGEVEGHKGTGDRVAVKAADGAAGDFVGAGGASFTNASYIIRAASTHVAEGKYVSLAISRIGDVSAAGEVTWKFSFGEGASAADFKDLKTSGVAHFGAGVNTGSESFIFAQTVDDGIKEGPETVTITLSGASGGKVGWSKAVTITIDDAGPEPINGTSKSDSNLKGTRGDDIINALEGNDTLIGGKGDDTLIGGSGRDTASYVSAGSGVVASLAKPSTNTSDAKGDKYSSIENITGSSYADLLTGNSSANRLMGGDGKDTLDGGAGHDTLKGGSGADYFRFTSKLSSANDDQITDFTHGEDKVQLDDAIFAALGASVTSSEFSAKTSGHIAADKQHIIYEKSDGTLWYDADDNGSGAAIQFATLSNKPQNLTYADFVIV